MTRAELLKRVKRDRPGESTEDELNLWIDQLDEKWTDEVLRTHEGAAEPENVPDIALLSKGRWWGENSEASGCGLTVTRRGPRIRIQGTADKNCQIWINGPALAVAESVQASWSYLSPMVGPAEGDWVVNYFYTREDNNSLGLKLGRSVDGTNVLSTTLAMTRGQSSVTGSNISWHNSSWSLGVSIGMTFPAGWEIVLLLGEETMELPEERIRRDLLIPALDDEVYVYWLYSKIDFRLGEMERYNNDATMFNTAWDTAAKRWHRSHMPLGRQVRHVVYGHPVPWRAHEDPLDQRRDWPRW